MAEVKVTLSDDMVRLLENLALSERKIADAAQHIIAAQEALTKLGLTAGDVAAIIAARAGTTKTAVLRIIQTMRGGNLDAHEIVAMFIAKKEGLGIQHVRQVLHALDLLVVQLKATDKPQLAAGEKEVVHG
jgi:hypothetical protein